MPRWQHASRVHGAVGGAGTVVGLGGVAGDVVVVPLVVLVVEVRMVDLMTPVVVDDGTYTGGDDDVGCAVVCVVVGPV